MIILAFAAFAILVLAWLLAPTGEVAAEAEPAPARGMVLADSAVSAPAS